jgi:homoserine dehydrogenase
MKHYNVCFVGFGNVGRALLRLLVAKSSELRDLYGIEWSVTGIATRRLGWIAAEKGLSPQQLLSNQPVTSECVVASGISEWLQQSNPEVVFETISLNHETGHPAIEYLRAALVSGAHAITANKGAVVYGYEELNRIANSSGRRFLFEASVLDSAPVFSLFQETLPGVKLRGFSGIFNSTTNVILEAMEAGRTFEEGVKAAQELGVAETDPAHDIDGWDATLKVCALARVLVGSGLNPGDVNREGIRNLSPQLVQAARAESKPFKLVARGRIDPEGTVSATVRPEQILSTDPLAGIRGTSLAVHFELDMMPGLTITSHRPNLQSTAYGLLSDFINAVRD